MARRFLLACIQLTSTEVITTNLDACRKWIREAARERGAELVILPEDYGYLALEERDKLELTRSERTRIVEEMREEAIRYGIYLLAGGVPLLDEEQNKIRNTAILFTPTGGEAARYEKIHLFDADPPGGTPHRESEIVVAGSQTQVVETPLASLGLSICYDLRFPELYRQLTLAGAELLLVPAAFTLTTGKDHWKVLLQARAIENQVYLAAAGQCGRHSARRHSFGSSLVCDPWGTMLATAPEGEGLAVAEFNPQRIENVRSILPCHRHLRRDIFSL